MHTVSPSTLPPGVVSGRLEGASIPDLVWSLCSRGMTGVLRVSRAHVRKTLYLSDGDIVFAASSDPNDRLGELLLRRGKITLDQLEAALRELASGKRLGTLLVESGGLTPQGLVEAVVEQVRAIVLDLLTWDEGEYAFAEGPLPTAEVITLQVRSAELLLQGIRRIGSLTRIRRSVGVSRTVYELTPKWEEQAAGLALTAGETLLLARLQRGPCRVESLCREMFLSNFELYQALWAFRLLGIAVPSEAARVAIEPAARAGQLERTGFAELLVELSRQGASGMLVLVQRGVERSFHLHEGRCVFATSTNPDDSLTAFLLRRGVISISDAEEVGRRLLSNRRVGSILQEIGAIEAREVEDLVRQQLIEIVLDSFQWDEGDYEFRPGPLPSHEPIALEMTLEALVSAGLRRVASWTRVIKGCGGIDSPLAMTPRFLEILDAMGAGVEEWQVVNALKIPQSPRRVCRALPVANFRVCQTLWALVLLGAVEPRAAEQVDDLPEWALAGAPPPEVISPAVHEVAESPAVWAAGDVAREIEPPGGEVSTVPGGSQDIEAPHRSEAAARHDAAPGGIRATTPTEASPRVADTVQLSRAEVEAALSTRPPDEAGASPAGPDSDWKPPEDLDAVIARFNAMHQVVYRTLRTEIGAGAANFVRSCWGQLVDTAREAMDSAELHSDGTWDVEGLRRAVVHHRIQDPTSVYQELIDKEIEVLRLHLGEPRAVRLVAQVREVEEALPSSPQAS